MPPGPEHALIAFEVDVETAAHRMRFNRKLFGTSTTVKGRWYWRPGLLQEIRYWRVTRGVIVVPASDAGRVMREMRKWGGQVWSWPVGLGERDAKRVALHEAGHREL